MTRLLPPNASQLEVRAAQALAQIEHVPVPIRELINPDLCPVELLPYLAWAFSVDRWEESWAAATKRKVIKSAHFVHAHKGTIGALRRVVEPLGYVVNITEWWQEQPEGTPGTFRIEIGIRGTGVSQQTYELLLQLLGDAKPVSRGLSSLKVNLESAGAFYLGAVLADGNETTVYPYAIANLESAGHAFLACAVQDVTNATIYPEGWKAEAELARLAGNGAQRLTEAGYVRTVEY